ncbi:MAG: zinc ribbon domain-containing protein [Syntrophales bacterium]|nr:zinc ribbon domain-containing protein [Syntrophales bacterium]
MPIYEYRCRKCGKEYEVLQRITDPAVNACKFCHGPVEKLVSLSSFHLKGSGWYVTDYSGKKVSSTEGKKEETTEPSSSAESGKGKSPSRAGGED